MPGRCCRVIGGTAEWRRRSPIEACYPGFYRDSRVAVPRPTPVPSPGPPPVFMIEICCAPGPTYMLKVGPSVIEIVPVQFGATV